MTMVATLITVPRPGKAPRTGWSRPQPRSGTGYLRPDQTGDPRGAHPVAVLVGDDVLIAGQGVAQRQRGRGAGDEPGPGRPVVSGVDVQADRDPSLAGVHHGP